MLGSRFLTGSPGCSACEPRSSGVFSAAARGSLVLLALALAAGVGSAQVSEEFPEIGGKVLKIAKKLEKTQRKAQGRVESETEKLLSKLEKALKGLQGTTGDTVRQERRNLAAVITALQVGADLPEETQLTLPKALGALADHEEAFGEIRAPVDELLSDLRFEIGERINDLTESRKSKNTDLELEDLNLLSDILQTRFALHPRITFKKLEQLASKALPLEQWQAAIDSALVWLVRHQSEDGSWVCAKFQESCAEGEGECDGPGFPIHNTGVTGLALIALMKAADPEDTSAQGTIDRGLRFLVKQCSSGGLVGAKTSHAFLYNHAFATLALCEAGQRPGVDGLESAVARAVGYAAAARNPLAAWRYAAPPIGDNDTSVTGWMVALLASARRGGHKVHDANFKGALTWVRAMTAKDGRVGYDRTGSLSARTPENEEYPRAFGEAMTASGLCMLADISEALGRPRSKLLPEGLLPRMEALVYASPPARRADDLGVDLYYWMMGARALSGDASPRANIWRLALGNALLNHQESAGCARGSWDPVGVWGREGGRVYATATSAIALRAALDG